MKSIKVHETLRVPNAYPKMQDVKPFKVSKIHTVDFNHAPVTVPAPKYNMVHGYFGPGGGKVRGEDIR